MARMDDLRYPTGRFTLDPHVTPEKRAGWIRRIAEVPSKLRSTVQGLDESRLQTPYRPGGWSVRQVIHHLPESHMNAFVRFKLALTEDTPTVKPYDEAAWSNIADTARTPIDVSLTLLDALHARWVILLESLAPADFSRRLFHPEQGAIDLEWMLQQYAWHGHHHIAQIEGLRKREGWN
jgi:hypothetical protein